MRRRPPLSSIQSGATEPTLEDYSKLTVRSAERMPHMTHAIAVVKEAPGDVRTDGANLRATGVNHSAVRGR